MSNFITKAGLAELQAEYREILDIKVPAVLSGLNEAMAMGDLSENAARDALLNEQQSLNARKQEIEDILNDYEIIDSHDHSLTTGRTIRVGSVIKLQYIDEKKDFIVQIMGISEADILADDIKISNESPLAQAILGKKVNEIVQVYVKQAKHSVKILEITD